METTSYTKTRDLKTKVLPGIRHSTCGLNTIRRGLVEKRSENVSTRRRQDRVGETFRRRRSFKTAIVDCGSWGEEAPRPTPESSSKTRNNNNTMDRKRAGNNNNNSEENDVVADTASSRDEIFANSAKNNYPILSWAV